MIYISTDWSLERPSLGIPTTVLMTVRPKGVVKLGYPEPCRPNLSGMTRIIGQDPKDGLEHGRQLTCSVVTSLRRCKSLGCKRIHRVPFVVE